MASLESRLDTLRMAHDNLKQRVDSMSGDQVAVLTPNADGFNYLSDGTIAVTVSIVALEQVGSGVRAKFQIGNLTSGQLVKCWSFMNVRKSKDGPFEKGAIQYFKGTLKPGFFTQTETVLPDLKVADISAIQLSSLLCERVVLST